MKLEPPNPDLPELVYHLLKLFPHLHIREMALLCEVAVLSVEEKPPTSFDIQRAVRTLLDAGRLRYTAGYHFEVIDVQAPPQAPPAGTK